LSVVVDGPPDSPPLGIGSWPGVNVSIEFAGPPDSPPLGIGSWPGVNVSIEFVVPPGDESLPDSGSGSVPDFVSPGKLSKSASAVFTRFKEAVWSVVNDAGADAD